MQPLLNPTIIDVFESLKEMKVGDSNQITCIQYENDFNKTCAVTYLLTKLPENKFICHLTTANTANDLLERVLSDD